ncbi:MAG: energy transducer TonB [Bacteroidota bacterium]
MNALSYLIQVNLYVVLFYTAYLLLLRKETFFKMNRFYLVGSAILSLAIPLLKMDWIKDLFVTEQVYHVTQTLSSKVNNIVVYSQEFSDKALTNSQISSATSADMAKKVASGFSIPQVFLIIYSTITLLFLLNFFRKLFLVHRALRGSQENKAFSFFNKVIVDNKLECKETIMNHEMVHVRQWHSLDVIFFELFAAINWLNPVSYAYKKAIRNIHEFIADETAASGLRDKTEYALLLVSNAFGAQPQQLTNSFYNDSLIKRRLIMLNKNKSRKVAILKYGLAVPLFAAMVIFSSATSAGKKVIATIAETTSPVMASLSNPELTGIEDTESANLHVSTSDSHTDSTPATSNVEVTEAHSNPDMRILIDYFTRSTKYPAEVQESKTVGNSFLSFDLDEKGAITNPVVIKAMNGTIENELMRVVQKAQPFGPGLKGKYILPIKFSLNFGPNENLAYDNVIDYSNYKDHTILNEIHIRGYLKSSIVSEKPIDELRRYFMKTTRYPAAAQEKRATGENWIAFEIDKSGSILNPTVIKTADASMEYEILRVLKSYKPTVTGLEGKYVMPINFVLSGFKDPGTNTPLQLKDYENHTILGPVIIRGYVKLTAQDSINARSINLEVKKNSREIYRYVIADETKEKAGKFVDYIKADYLKKPIIIVDGKKAGYKITDGKGFMLTNSIYPKKPKITIYEGEEAVKHYNKSAKKRGLIVITTN